MARTRVWVGSDRVRQHFADPPGDDVSREWDGVTACGVEGRLHWIHGEHVDTGSACPDCIAVEGTMRPELEGDYPGPP